MTGQRRAIVCKFDMLPPPGEACQRALEVDNDRRVAGEVLFKKGHIALDCRRTASMVAVVVRELQREIEYVCGYWKLHKQMRSLSRGRQGLCTRLYLE